jgi:integrase
MFLLGLAGALRRSELVGVDLEHVTWTKDGLRLLIERSKTDTQGEGAEIAIPCEHADDTCPATALKTWLELSEITAGPLFRKVNRGGVVERTRLTTDAVRQILLMRAAKAGLKGTLAEPFSPHGPVPTKLCKMAIAFTEGAFCQRSERTGRRIRDFPSPGATIPDPGLPNRRSLAVVRRISQNL